MQVAAEQTRESSRGGEFDLIVLSSTDSIRVVTSTANALHVLSAHADNAAASFTPAPQPTTIAAAATTTVVSPPAAATTRNISFLSFRAVGGLNVVTVQFFNGAAFEIVSVSLAVGERLEYENGKGWTVTDSTGATKTLTSASFALARIRVNGTDQTQRASVNMVDTATVSWTGTDDGLNQETELRASVVNNSIGATQITNNSIGAAQQAQMAANTIKGNPTAALANESDIAMAVQTALFRGSGNITGGAAVAGQFLGRSLAGGDLSFQLLPGLGTLLRAPQIVLATNAAFAHPTGTRIFIAEGVASGGGGGGAAAVAGAVGSGGNAGNWGRKAFTSISGTSNITIGAAGTTGSGVAGGNGGNCSIVHNAVTFTLVGGVGGTILAGAATIASAVINAANAANTGADIDELGERGAPGYRCSAAATSTIGGKGGTSKFGAGGLAQPFLAGAGAAASGRGAGGSGGAAPAAVAVAGGAATAGAFVIWEFG